MPSSTTVVRGVKSAAIAVVVAAGFLLIAYLVLKVVPDQLAQTTGLDPQARVQERQGIRTASLALLAGVIAILSAVYTARTFALNRAGQITDRFTTAINQLGHSELDVRLGGIYALERIARDSKGDHPQIVEVLTAYIREHAPSDGHHRVGVPPDDVAMGAAMPGPRVPTDVQAAATVLGRRRVIHDAGGHIVLDLARTRLVGIQLAGSSLGRTDLGGANLWGANVSNADLRGAHLVGARLEDADLRGADLYGADLTGALLARARLADACLTDATLAGANLCCANLEGADLARANLRDADLTEANLQHARLDAASLGNALVAQADFTEARCDDRTSWPAGFDPKAAGCRKWVSSRIYVSPTGRPVVTQRGGFTDP